MLLHLSFLLQIARNRLAYFKSFWNIVDVVIVATAACVIAFNIHRTVIVDSLLSTLLQRPDVFADFSSLSYWQYVFNVLIAVLVFVAWLKLFKFIAFNRTMTHLSSTLSRAAKDVAAYALMFFIVFFAFAQLGYLLFGAHLHDFCSFGDSVCVLYSC
jgi:polycystin 2